MKVYEENQKNSSNFYSFVKEVEIFNQNLPVALKVLEPFKFQEFLMAFTMEPDDIKGIPNPEEILPIFERNL